MSRRVEQGLWAIASAATLATVAVSWAVTRPASVAAWVMVAADTGMPTERTGAGELARRITASDPFRVDRRPADVPFGSDPVQPVDPVLTARPPLVVGILGPPWRAALEGIPGREGSMLVAAGDTLNGWRVVAVRRDSVVIEAPNITWRLAVRSP